MKKKKTVIFSEKQISEVCCDGNPAYLDKILTNDDAPNFANKISADGAGGHPVTADDYADDTYSPLQYGVARTAVLREMTKQEWKEAVIKEIKQHGNQFLMGRNFGASGGDIGKSYDATKTAISRKRRAEKTAATGATPEIRNKAAKTVERMRKNWNNIDKAETQYKAAKDATNSIPRNIKSAPKESGNGKAHSIKVNDGFIS